MNSWLITELLDFKLGLFSCFSLTLIHAFFWQRKASCLPPGPPGLPIIGNIHQLKSASHKILSKWAKTYGSFYTIDLFGRKAVILNDVQSMKNVFGREESMGKLKEDWFGILFQQKYGIANTTGFHAFEQRKFFLRALKAIGVIGGGRRSHESNVLEQANKICDNIKETLKINANQVLYLTGDFNDAAFITMWNTVSGENFDNSKSKRTVQHFVNQLLKYLDLSSSSGLNIVPVLKHLAFIFPSYRGLIHYAEKLRHEIKSKFEITRISQCLIEKDTIFGQYTKKVETCDNSDSSFYGDLGWKNSYRSIMALLMASTDTTATTLKWMIFYLASNQGVQAKLFQEIKEVLGNNEPTISHKHRMQYSQAVLLEVLRMSSILPFGIFHELLGDIQLNEYTLPKGTILISNTYHAHFDEDVWGDPENFRPERFLLEANNNKQDNCVNSRLKQNVVAFQLGKRACPGESIAKDTLFLFMVKLVQSFVFEIDPKVNREKFTEPQNGFFLKPRDFGVIVKARQ